MEKRDFFYVLWPGTPVSLITVVLQFRCFCLHQNSLIFYLNPITKMRGRLELGGLAADQRVRVTRMHPVGGLRPPYLGMLETRARPPPPQKQGVPTCA